MAVSRKTGYTISHETLEEMRFTAIRMVKRQIPVEIIAESMKLNRSTVFAWLRKFRLYGLKALKSTKATGAPPKLEQKKIFRLIKMLRKPAREYGFASDLWTGPRVRFLIKKQFEVELHRTHMPRFLRRLGLVQKSPERRAIEQDERAVRRWVRYELPRINRLVAATRRGLLLYGDESCYRLIPYVGKTWTFPELRPIARVSGQKGVYVGVTSAVSPKGHLAFQLAKGNFNAAVFIRFLKALRKHFPQRKLFLVIDGAPVHIAGIVKQFAKDNKKWLSLHYLPGYSPELNADEEVWNFTKTKKLNARALRDRKELKSAVVGSLRSLQKRPMLVQNFFNK